MIRTLQARLWCGASMSYNLVNLCLRPPDSGPWSYDKSTITVDFPLQPYVMNFIVFHGKVQRPSSFTVHSKLIIRMDAPKKLQDDKKANINDTPREVAFLHLGNLEMNLDTAAELFKSAALAYFVGKTLVAPLLSFLGESRRLCLIAAAMYVQRCKSPRYRDRLPVREHILADGDVDLLAGDSMIIWFPWFRNLAIYFPHKPSSLLGAHEIHITSRFYCCGPFGCPSAHMIYYLFPTRSPFECTTTNQGLSDFTVTHSLKCRVKWDVTCRWHGQSISCSTNMACMKTQDFGTNDCCPCSNSEACVLVG